MTPFVEIVEVNFAGGIMTVSKPGTDPQLEPNPGWP